MAAKYEANLDFLASLSIMDLADMPETPALPSGTYQGIFSGIEVSLKDAEGDQPQKIRVGVTLQLLTAVELEKPEELAELESIKEGQELTYYFYMGNPYGEGSLKKVLLPLANELSIPVDGGLAVFNEALADKPVTFQATRRPNTRAGSGQKWNTDLRAITTVEVAPAA